MIATTTTRGRLLVPCIVSVLLLTASAFDSAPPTLLHAAGSGDLPAEPSAYEMLEGFGFPRGILPVGVTGYKYRPSDGAFQVFFDGDCEFEVDGYRIKYRQVISGNVEGGSIRNLGGVSVRMFLLNWGIDRVVMEGPGQLVFHVGPLSQVFSADNFEVSPECRCRGNVVMAAAMSDGVAAV